MEVPEAEGNKTRKKFRGVYKTFYGKWAVKIYDRNNRRMVHLGTYGTAEEGARAYDEAALKTYQGFGGRAKLNFPAETNISYSHSVELHSIPSTRKSVSQSSPVSPEEGQNHQSGLEQLQQKHQNVQKPMLLLQEQPKDVETAGYVYGTRQDAGSQSSTGPISSLPSLGEDQNHEPGPEHFQHFVELHSIPSTTKCVSQSSPVSPEVGKNYQSGLEQLQQKHQNFRNPMLLQEQPKDVEITGYVYGTRQDAGSQSSTGPISSPPSHGEDQNHEPGPEDFQELDSDGQIMNLLMASLANPTEQTFPDPDIVEMEGNVADGTPIPIFEKQIDPSSQQPPKILRAANWSQMSASQDGRSVHDDGGKMMVKVYKDDMIIKFELSLSSTKLELEENVAVRLKLPVGSFGVRYQDEDQDWITITCDEDLRTCMSTSRSLGNATIRMVVVCH